MEARFYEKSMDGQVRCILCPHRCAIFSGSSGLCGARENHAGTLYAATYGRVTGAALDPIEKKPLRTFLPGSHVLSFGSYGCNFLCPFCQNHGISQSAAAYNEYAPEYIARAAWELRNRGNIGVAYTYNEPVTFYEYTADISRLVRAKNMKNILVTNGYINNEPLCALLPLIDAMAIDLKSIHDSFYRRIGGTLAPVLNTIGKAWEAGVHVEVITLVIPGENDSPEEIDELSGWLGSVSPAIPLHLTRFVPHHLYRDRDITPRQKTMSLAEIARRNLSKVLT